MHKGHRLFDLLQSFGQVLVNGHQCLAVFIHIEQPLTQSDIRYQLFLRCYQQKMVVITLKTAMGDPIRSGLNEFS